MQPQVTARECVRLALEAGYRFFALPLSRSLSCACGYQDETVVSVAEKHGKTAAQVLGRWCVQKGIIYIPKSVKEERMRENLLVFDWSLDADDM